MKACILTSVTIFLGIFLTNLTAADLVPAENYDLVIEGGRVMDPETGLDGIRNVGITNGRVMIVSQHPLQGSERISASGLVVAPGFIDLNTSGQDPVSDRLQALDGVTTALEMEGGVYPVGKWLASREGRAVVNYGCTVGHWPARVKLVDGLDVGQFISLPESEQKRMDEGNYAHQELTLEQIGELSRLLEEGLDEGGLGIGFAIAYIPGASRLELLRLFQLASRRDAGVYIHLREKETGGTLGAYEEAIALAASTGVSVHIVHLNSTAQNEAKVVLELIRGASKHGVDVTTEAYPYTASSLRIEYAALDALEGTCPNSFDYSGLIWTATGEHLTCESFQQYRKQGGWIIRHSGLTEEISEWIAAQTDVIVASDGIPYLFGPAHPRGAGTFARVLGYYVREKGQLTLMDALRKMTLLPAQRVEAMASSMKRKGRVQKGADADLTIFDPTRIIDNATYEKSDLPSSGIVHVLVGGTFVVRDSKFVDSIYPGRAVRGDSYNK